MAKSKKALKALRRRKSAKGRSRALKERQDYTLGGRVKKQVGGGNFSNPEFNQNEPPVGTTSNEQQPPTGNEQPPQQTFSTERPTDGRFGVGHEGKNLSEADVNYLSTQGVTVQADGSVAAADFKAWADTRGGVRPPPSSTATTTTRETPASTETSAEETPPVSTTPPAEQTPAAPTLSEEDIYRTNFKSANEWGNQAPSGSYSYDFIQDSGRYIIKMPDGTLTQASTLEEAQRLSGASSPYLGTTPDRPPAEEEAPEEDITKAPAVDYEEFIASRMELRGQTREEAIAHLNNALNQTNNFADYNKDGVVENAEWAEWKKLSDTNKDGRVTVEENAAAVRQLKSQLPGETNYADDAWLDNKINEEVRKKRGYTSGYIIIEDLNFSGEEERLYDLNIKNWEENNTAPLPYIDQNGNEIPTSQYNEVIGQRVGGINIPKDGSVNPKWTEWNARRLAAHNGFITRIQSLPRNEDGTIKPLEQDAFSDNTRVPYSVPGLNQDVAKSAVSTLIDPDRGLPDNQFSEAGRIEQFERDAEGNIVLDGDGNPVYRLQSVEELTDTAVGVTAFSADTVADSERQLTSAADIKTEAAKFGVDAPTLKVFTSVEADYYARYPNAKKAVDNGAYPDFIAYHAAVGKGRNYVLGFEDTDFAEGEVGRLAEASAAIRTKTDAAERDRVDETAALAPQTEFSEDLRSQVDPVTGETIQLAATPDAERQQRNAILDEVAATGTEAIIVGSVGYEAAERREVKGEAAKGAARSLLQEIGEIPENIAEAILDNPASVTAQVDTAEVQVQAAIAAMPQEALVSAQLESLLAGIDEGTTPTWARPAVQLVESRLNARGLSVSTVGRDALFNAIIQTSIPIAQSNAAALQQRANQNLSNQQQANLQQSAQEMQLRLTNVANRQSAESQSATLAQQINLTQEQFTQQAQVTESEQRQQVRLASLQNEQQAEMANLGNDQQIELANLQVEAERMGADQSAVNQERMAEMQVSANFMQKNQEFVQQMELANLSNDQQMRLSFLTAKNQAESENLTNAQQTELANLNKRLEVNKINANLAQQMGLAQLNVDQQSAMQNASTVANIDLTKFNATQQIELANSKFIQTATLQDLNNRQQTILQDATTLASMRLQAADSLTKVSIENARNFLSMDMANLNNEQQSYMLDSQQKQQRMLSDVAQQNAARQFNATSDLQTQQYVTSLAGQLAQFNSQQVNSLEQFNSAETNRVAAINAGNELQAEQFLSQINTQIRQFNSQQDVQVEQFNVANAQAVEQSNVEWRRKANLADTAATNASNQQQASFQFDMNKTALSQAWQSLRDQANFDFQEYQSDKERKVSAINAILANEAFMTEKKYDSQRTRLLNLMDDFGDSLEDIRGSAAFELTPELTEA